MTDIDIVAQLEMVHLSWQKLMEEENERFSSPVQQFYSDTTVFVTGGNGFLGKQLIEKLFRSCNVGRVYILMRSKKGHSVEDRLGEMLKDPVFDEVRRKKPDFEQHITSVEGDVSDIRLGLSDEDWTTLTNEVNIIFHMAATTRFDEKIRAVTLINVRGSREALTLGKACKNLRSFVYVSTAYSNVTTERVETDVLEKFYPSPVPPAAMISMAESVEEERLNSITEQLIKGYPNTYTFAKCTAEELVRSEAGNLPICVVRPAIVIGALREPALGWMDVSCAYSATGVIVGCATGLIHIWYGDGENKLNLVPVDLVNNLSIVAGFETARRYAAGERDAEVYCIASASNKLTFGDAVKCAIEFDKLSPITMSMYYVFVYLHSNRFVYFLAFWLFHFIPGYVLDALCVLIRTPPINVLTTSNYEHLYLERASVSLKNPLLSMVGNSLKKSNLYPKYGVTLAPLFLGWQHLSAMFNKLYNKVYKLSLALSYFLISTWHFEERNTSKLFASLTPNDKLIFNFDTSSMDLGEMMKIWCLGVKKFIFKHDDKNTEYAKKKQFWFHKLNYVIMPLYIYGLWKLLSMAFLFIINVFIFLIY